MRPRAWVEHQPVRGVGCLVEVLAEHSLVVGLLEGGIESELLGEALNPHLELRERQPAVDLRVAPVEYVEVHAVHDLNAVLHRAISSIAASSACGSTSWPGVTSPGASTSTNGTLSPLRFLSRDTSAATSAGVAPSRRCGSPRVASSSPTSARSASRSERRSAHSSPRPTASPCR